MFYLLRSKSRMFDADDYCEKRYIEFVFLAATQQLYERFSPSAHFEFTDGYEMIHKAWSSIEEVPYCYQGRLPNAKVTRTTNRRLWLELRVSGL